MTLMNGMESNLFFVKPGSTMVSNTLNNSGYLPDELPFPVNLSL